MHPRLLLHLLLLLPLGLRLVVTHLLCLIGLGREGKTGYCRRTSKCDGMFQVRRFERGVPASPASPPASLRACSCRPAARARARRPRQERNGSAGRCCCLEEWSAAAGPAEMSHHGSSTCRNVPTCTPCFSREVHVLTHAQSSIPTGTYM